MKVISDKTGIIHAYAQCQNCTWDYAMEFKLNNRMQKLRNNIAAHIKSTGHVVVLETGNSTTYSLEKNNDK